MSEKRFVSGDEAVALAAKQCRPQVIAAYPITPQTIVVERLADYVEDGSLECQYMYVDSEHSAMTACIGAAGTGARCFTATSSQGLLYMAECLHYASGARMPIVMMNANRSLATPWNIYGDQRDSLSQLESGWIQLYAADAQEAFDLTIQAYKIAEDPEIMTPVMVNLDGFILTHTYETIETVDQEKVDQFIPYQKYANAMDLENPKGICITAGPPYNLEFHYTQHMAMMKALDKINAVGKEYGEVFGREYSGVVDAYCCDDADVIIATLGSVSNTAKFVVNKLRKEGKKVGVLKLRCVRPFPVEAIAEAVKNAKGVVVVERDLSFGYEGAVFSDFNSALKQKGIDVPTYNYVGGLGGRSLDKTDLEKALEDVLEGKAKTDEVEFIKLRRDICGA